jgi:hypothetical protein
MLYGCSMNALSILYVCSMPVLSGK